MEQLQVSDGDRDWAEWHTLKAKLDEAYCNEENYWRQKSRIQWLEEGDQNTKFFHASTTSRRCRNRIEKLGTEQGVECSTPDQIEAEITDCYSKLFSSSIETTPNSFLSCLKSTITSSMNQRLIKPVDNDEIKKALFSMNPLKAPGPDGMTLLFFQHFWYIIESDICIAIKDFFASSQMMKAVNHTLISLIPKTQNPTSIAQFRPISLCNVLYKIISKILAERLKHCLPHCISEYQSAFIKGRQILDNIVVAHECAHQLKNHRKGRVGYMAIKLDMSKAFDRVEWKFLVSTMLQMGFEPLFVNWIYTCISTASFSFNVNGQSCGYVTPTRGIQQGDPLSPYLFLICSEVFSQLLQAAAANGSFKGLKVAKAWSGHLPSALCGQLPHFL